MAIALKEKHGPEKGREFWILKVRALRARYEYTEDFWAEKFGGNDTASEWYRSIEDGF